MTGMVTTQIRCPHCQKRTRICDIVYPADAQRFRVVVICHNRLCRAGFTVWLPEREIEAIAS